MLAHILYSKQQFKISMVRKNCKNFEMCSNFKKTFTSYDCILQYHNSSSLETVHCVALFDPSVPASEL